MDVLAQKACCLSGFSLAVLRYEDARWFPLIIQNHMWRTTAVLLLSTGQLVQLALDWNN